MTTSSNKDKGFNENMKKLTWADKKFGKWCDKCKRRKGTLMASKGAEGGKDSICKCDDKK